MKRSEFIKRVEELGYKVHEGDNYLSMSSGVGIIARVYEDITNAIDTYWNVERSISNDLLDLCVEYATTPIEERKSEKKYCLKLPFQQENLFGYLNYNKESKEYIFSSNGEHIYYKTQFTQREIDALPNQDFIRMLIKEEVE